MKLGAKAERVYLQIKQCIDKGVNASGARLPSEKDLLEQYGVSRNTVRAALKKLINDGVVESIQGAGFYVKTLKPGSKIVSFMYHGDMDTVIKVQNLLFEHGCLMSLFSQAKEGWSVEFEAEFLQRVLAQKQHGLIASCTPIPPWNEELLEKLDNSGIKIIHTEPYRNDALPEQNFIMPDYYDAGRRAAETFVKRGCDNVVFVSGSSPETPFAKLAGRGYGGAVQRFGLKTKIIYAEDEVRIKSQLSGLKGKTGVIAVPLASAERLLEVPGLEGNIISLSLPGDANEHNIPVAAFDRDAIFRRAVEVMAAPGETVRELIPAEL